MAKVPSTHGPCKLCISLEELLVAVPGYLGFGKEPPPVLLVCRGGTIPVHLIGFLYYLSPADQIREFQERYRLSDIHI